MKRIVAWMFKHLVPVSDKISKNPWIGGVQDALVNVLPIVLVGALSSLITGLKGFIPFLPDLTMVGNFSFGLMGLFVCFLTPYRILERKSLSKMSMISGFTAICCYIISTNMVFDESGIATFEFARLGNGGLFVSLVIGFLVALVFNLFHKTGLMKNKTSIPDFVYSWFVNLIPIMILVVGSLLLVYGMGIDVFKAMMDVFNPFIAIGQTFWGYVILCFLMGLIYSLGISAWAIFPVVFTISLAGMADNAKLIAQGLAATNINTLEVITFVSIGGTGTTLMLNVFMALSKSKKLKVIGRSTLLPSLFNINEPVIYGAPIAMNPILMIPMIINSFIVPAITYLTFSSNLMPIPTNEAAMAYWFMPPFVAQYLTCGNFMSLILTLVILVVTGIVWFPFFRTYEKKCLIDEAAEVTERSKFEVADIVKM